MPTLPWFILVVVACFKSGQDGISTWEDRPDFERHYKAAGVRGAFVLYDLKNDKYLAYDSIRVHTPFIPASTYKILNSLIALEAGVIKDENEIIPWDGVDRGSEGWNRDHNLRSAFQASAVWFYQVLARRIGEQRMRQFVEAAGYGNRDIGGGIDTFWLTGNLRITPKEQIDFLVKLHRHELPFSRRTSAIIKDIMVLEDTGEYVMRAKTGQAGQIGWCVGYVERGDQAHFFANSIDILKTEDRKARIEISKNILRALGLISP